MHNWDFRLLLWYRWECTLLGCYAAYINSCLPAALEDGTDRLSQKSVHNYQYMWCGRKVMRLAMLCTNQQHCCLPFHTAV